MGFLKGNTSEMKHANIFIYWNGLCVVQTDWGDYISVTKVSDVEYRLDGSPPGAYDWTRFLVAE
jgi:hypothetical protein